MSLSVSVTYPKPIVIERGSLVEVMGTFTGPNELAAFLISDADKGIVYQLTPDETPRVDAYQGTLHWQVPLIGQVVSSGQYNDRTRLDVFPTGQTVRDYIEIQDTRMRAAVPAYWRLFDDKQEWESKIRSYERMFTRPERDAPKRLDTRDTLFAVHQCFGRKRDFVLPVCVEGIAQSANKAFQAERHLERIRLIDTLRTYLYEASDSEGRRNLLTETREETALVAEATIIAIYSALDTLALAINQFYRLNLSENTTGFIIAVTGKHAPTSDTIEMESESRSLQRDHPTEPLTEYLLQQLAEWVYALAGWRHFIVHRGCLQTVEAAKGGAFVCLPDDRAGLDELIRSQSTASSLIEHWIERLKELLSTSYRLIKDRAAKIVDLPNEEHPIGNQPAAMMTLDRSPYLKPVIEFLDLWKRSLEDEPRKLEFMYSKLTREWQREWKRGPFGTDRDAFGNFIEGYPLLDYHVRRVSGSSDASGERYLVDVDMTSPFGTATWGFAVMQAVGKWRLYRVPYSTIPSPICRLALLSFKRAQSSQETGYCHMDFDGEIRNYGDVILSGLSVHVFYEQHSEASAELGDIVPGEIIGFRATWPNAFVTSPGIRPVMGGLLLHAPIRLRMIYHLDVREGCYWAEEIDMGSQPPVL